MWESESKNTQAPIRVNLLIYATQEITRIRCPSSLKHLQGLTAKGGWLVTAPAPEKGEWTQVSDFGFLNIPRKTKNNHLLLFSHLH